LLARQFLQLFYSFYKTLRHSSSTPHYRPLITYYFKKKIHIILHSCANFYISDEEKAIILRDNNHKKIKLSSAEKLLFQQEIDANIPLAFESLFQEAAQKIVSQRPKSNTK
jgi:hypothetical protein